MLRVYLDLPIAAGAPLALPPDAARHVQVLRLQPADPIILFNGQGGEWQGEVVSMGRRDVTVRAMTHCGVDRERPGHITLAAGMPANDRFDWLVEKATELGAHAIQPLLCERSVLKVQGERAERKAAHWRGVAIAAAEQSGRTSVPTIHIPLPLSTFLAHLQEDTTIRLMLSLGPDAAPPPQSIERQRAVFLSGPEGGLSPSEESAARARGFRAITLGPRILRAETAPLACLAGLSAG